MTIFDIRPYSFWRNLHRASVYGWVHRGHDTPRTVLRLYLLEYIVQYQSDIIGRLTAQNGPGPHRTDVRRPSVPANGVTPEIAAIPPATNESEATEPETPRHSGDRLPFDQLDPLVRKEIKRLAMDGRIPSARLWDAERNKRLPTYGAVMQRYGCTNLHDFAERMNMQPPLSPKRFPEHKGEVYAATA